MTEEGRGTGTYQIRTQDVARLVPELTPSSSLLGTQQYSTPAVSSAKMGKWLITSNGVILAATTRRPFSPFRSALMTSLTPRLS